MSYNAAAYVFDGGINFGSAETLDLFTISLLFLCNRRNEALYQECGEQNGGDKIKEFRDDDHFRPCQNFKHAYRQQIRPEQMPRAKKYPLKQALEGVDA